MNESDPARASGEEVLAGVPLRRQLLFGAVLLGLGLLVAEAGMRLVFQLRGDLPPTPDRSLVYEWKWAQERLALGTARGESTALLTFDADLGWRPRAGHREEGVRINAQGLRADRDFAPVPPPGRRRLALLGDSFTFGDHVANDETFAHFLASEELPGWDVLNFGVNGYGTDQALLRWELEGRPLAADVVVMGFYVGDYERNTLRFKLYAKPLFEVAGDALRLAHHPVIAPEALYAEYVEGRRVVGAVDRPYLVLSVAKALRRLRERNPSRSDPEWQVLARLMRRFRDGVVAAGATPVWLVLPYRDVVEGGRSREAAIEEMCEAEALALGLPVLRVDAALRDQAAARPEVLLYRPREQGGHFSAAGHRLVAQRLAAFLRAREGVDPGAE